MLGYGRTLAAAAVFVQACGASDPSIAEQAEVVISDSLGVTVVINRMPVRPSGSWRLGQVVTAIGTVEGDSTQILASLGPHVSTFAILTHFHHSPW